MIKSKFIMAGRSKPMFDEVFDSCDYIGCISVGPLENDLVVVPPGFQITIEDHDKKNRCYLDFVKKDETSSMVRYLLEDVSHLVTKWEVETNESYEHVTVSYLTMLLNKSKNVLKELWIIGGDSTVNVNELPFDTFKLPNMSQLKILDILPESYDLIQCGCINLEQLSMVEDYVQVMQTSFRLDQLFFGKCRVFGIDQCNLTRDDILAYLESLRDSKNRGTLTIDLVDMEKPNYINIDIMPHIERVLRGFSLRSMKSESNDDGFEIRTIHEEFEVSVELRVKECLIIDSTLWSST